MEAEHNVKKHHLNCITIQLPSLLKLASQMVTEPVEIICATRMSEKNDNHVIVIYSTYCNDLRLHKSHFKYDMRKFYFANRVVDHWNCLPSWVVTANNIKLFTKDLISIGNIRILFTISERKFKELEELEVVVRFLVYYSIFYSIMSVVDN